MALRPMGRGENVVPLELSEPKRILIRDEVTAPDVAQLQAAPEGVTIQFDAPLKPASFDLLEAELFARRSDATLRIYSHDWDQADLSFLARMPSVARFSADCLDTAANVEYVAELPQLRELRIGIYDLTDFDFLDRIPAEIEVLSLGQTRSKRPSIAALQRFRQLRHLTLDGHSKGLDRVGELGRLEELTLWHYSNPRLEFLKHLNRLRRLEVNLGGGLDYSAIGLAPSLEELHLIWIRRLEDLSFVGQMSSLRFLMLDRLAQVRRLPDMSGLSNLTKLTITKLKSLESLAPIATAPSLEELRCFP